MLKTFILQQVAETAHASDIKEVQGVIEGHIVSPTLLAHHKPPSCIVSIITCLLHINSQRKQKVISLPLNYRCSNFIILDNAVLFQVERKLSLISCFNLNI